MSGASEDDKFVEFPADDVVGTLGRVLRTQATVAQSMDATGFEITLRLDPNVARSIARRLDDGGGGDVAVRAADAARARAVLSGAQLRLAACRIAEERREAWETSWLRGLLMGLFATSLVGMTLKVIGVLP